MQLKELAKLCNTSPSTVSRVLNGYTENFSVKPELRHRILALAKENGFTPNPVYRALRSKKNNLITVLFPQTDSRYSGALDPIYRMAGAFFKNGYGFSSFYSPANIESRMKSYYYLPFWKAGAYVLPDVSMPSQLVFLKKLNAPVLVLNGTVENSLWDVINTDEIRNLHTILEYLTEMGHSRIFYSNTYPDDPPHYSIADRYAGYVSACQEYGVPVLEGGEIRSRYASEQLDSIIAQKATAVIAYNGIIANRLLSAAWQRGLRVPEDFSLITFGDSNTQMEFTIPPLTCLNLPGEEMGDRAAEILMGRIAGDLNLSTDPISEKFPGHLVKRGSVKRFQKLQKNEVGK